MAINGWGSMTAINSSRSMTKRRELPRPTTATTTMMMKTTTTTMKARTVQLRRKWQHKTQIQCSRGPEWQSILFDTKKAMS